MVCRDKCPCFSSFSRTPVLFGAHDPRQHCPCHAPSSLIAHLSPSPENTGARYRLCAAPFCGRVSSSTRVPYARTVGDFRRSCLDSKVRHHSQLFSLFNLASLKAISRRSGRGSPSRAINSWFWFLRSPFPLRIALID